MMRLAIESSNSVFSIRAASPNPCVGAVVVTATQDVFAGCTEAYGGAHGEIVALRAARVAGADLVGATLYTTLEPCNHHGRTGPCSEAVIEAGIHRVVVGVADPDTQVSGAGLNRLRAAGLAVTVGVLGKQVANQLRFYLHHRRTGRPFVTLKLASSLDGRTAAPDGSSQWITGIESRTDTHRLRAEHDAILVGAGTVRADDPSLTVRLVDGPDPKRIVLGTASSSSRVQPCVCLAGPLAQVLAEVSALGVLSVFVEGGASVAREFHAARLVDSYVIYLAPALFGGDDALGMFRGTGASTMDNLWRGTLRSVEQFGSDLRIVLDPETSFTDPE